MQMMYNLFEYLTTENKAIMAKNDLVRRNVMKCDLSSYSLKKKRHVICAIRVSDKTRNTWVKVFLIYLTRNTDDLHPEKKWKAVREKLVLRNLFGPVSFFFLDLFQELKSGTYILCLCV